MRILICDDEKETLTLIHKYVQEYMNNHYIECIFALETNPEVILKNNTKYDLAFLDIQMEGLDGISLAKELKRHNEKIALFFVTNYGKYSDDAFDLRAFRFFQKPIDATRLNRSLDKAMEYINESYLEIYLQKANTIRRIPVDSILYITRENRKVCVTMQTEKIYVGNSFNELTGEIPNTFFYQIHNSFYVNLHHVIRYEYKELQLINGDNLPIAPRRQADFHKFWFNYLRRN